MKFQVIATAVLSTLLTLGVACSGDEEAKEPTEDGEGAGEEGDGEGGGDEGEGEGEGGSQGEAAETPPEETQTAEAAPPPAAEPPPPPPPAAEPAPAAAGPASFQGPKVVRYVTSYALNVRSEPSKTAKVLRHVKHGDKLEVVINGEWAQIGPGEFIAVSRLSETAPAAKKWKGGGAKKNGAKQKKGN